MADGPEQNVEARNPPSAVGVLHVGKCPITPESTPSIPGQVLPLTDERDRARGSSDEAPCEVMKQAKRDVDEGLAIRARAAP